MLTTGQVTPVLKTTPILYTGREATVDRFATRCEYKPTGWSKGSCASDCIGLHCVEIEEAGTHDKVVE